MQVCQRPMHCCMCVAAAINMHWIWVCIHSSGTDPSNGGQVGGMSLGWTRNCCYTANARVAHWRLCQTFAPLPLPAVGRNAPLTQGSICQHMPQHQNQATAPSPSNTLLLLASCIAVSCSQLQASPMCFQLDSHRLTNARTLRRISFVALGLRCVALQPNIMPFNLTAWQRRLSGIHTSLCRMRTRS